MGEEVSSGEEEELYFQEPKQLVDEFLALEEQNLFLIQNVQMTEHELEETERYFSAHTADMGEKTTALKRNTRKIQAQVAAEQAEIGRIQKLTEKVSSAEQDRETKDLTAKVSKAYQECLQDRDDPDTLQMLASIEATVEDLVEQLNRLRAEDNDLVNKLEKGIEKKRREEWRKPKLEDAKRLELSRQARLDEPVMRRVGKQIMFRSAKQQEKKVVVDHSEEEALQKDHALFG